MKSPFYPLMILGATSNAGKSFVATAFCRWFSRNGYSVHPFKSQNMSLNAMVTPEGDEIGVAQYSQALAANQTPSRHHNPILIKPQGNFTSQIILHGQFHETCQVQDYYAKKDFFSSMALQSFSKLNTKADTVILEGAGSPVELNLMDRDIANLHMARKVDAKCILVVNIELGGFFAITKGTLDLIPKADKKRIIGVVVNKFRGDRSIFLNDLSSFEKKIGVPVLGVLPHINNLALDVEDSVSLDDLGTVTHNPVVKIRIVRLPHISNFNEFQVFDHCPKVDWKFVEHPSSLGDADIIILPGTKMTLKDLTWLHTQKIDKAILNHVEKGKQLFGICGGFQMLGKTLKDPQGVEGCSLSSEKGLGFFDMETEFTSKKTLTHVTVTDHKKRIKAKAYEIHMGTGLPTNASPQLMAYHSDGKGNGTPEVWKKNNVFGTYLHGLFENKSFLEQYLPKNQWADMHDLRERTFNSLADTLEGNLNMKNLLKAISKENQIAFSTN